MAKKAIKILIIILLAFSLEIKADNFLDIGSALFIEKHQIEDSITKPKKEKIKSSRISKRVTFESFDQHYERALKYYNNRQWLSAAGLFEELYPLSLGTPRADTILYLFAHSYYQNGDFNMAAFHFRDYVKRYPNSERTEDAFYYCISAIYRTSPEYYLDQTNTDYAIEQIKTYVQAYPHNKHIDECNQMLDDLRLKLAKKDLEVIKLYYNTDHYEACQISAVNFFNEYSYSPLMPEAIYYLILNNFEYAKRSTERKKYERYKACFEACKKMELLYPESKYHKEVSKISQEVSKQLEKYNKKQS